MAGVLLDVGMYIHQVAQQLLNRWWTFELAINADELDLFVFWVSSEKSTLISSRVATANPRIIYSLDCTAAQQSASQTLYGR